MHFADAVRPRQAWLTLDQRLQFGQHVCRIRNVADHALHIHLALAECADIPLVEDVLQMRVLHEY